MNHSRSKRLRLHSLSERERYLGATEADSSDAETDPKRGTTHLGSHTK